MMVLRWIGAGCVFAGCGATGFVAAARLRKEERLLLQTIRLLEKMESELSYRTTPLPELCKCARGCGDQLERLYQRLFVLLQQREYPDAADCMEAALRGEYNLPQSVKQIHRMLGETLGMFDLSGQLEELSAVKAACQGELKTLRLNLNHKTKSYQTLGLCAGAALAILMM